MTLAEFVTQTAELNAQFAPWSYALNALPVLIGIAIYNGIKAAGRTICIRRIAARNRATWRWYKSFEGWYKR